MSGLLAGTGALTRFALRRDRVLIPVYLVVLVALVVSTAVQSEGLYATPGDRADYARSIEGNPGAIALVGPAYAVDTVGGDVAWQWGGFGAVTTALISMWIVGRHTRSGEQEGRSELLRAAPVGRLAPLTAAVVVAVAVNVVLAVALGVALVAQGLETGGSFALAVSLAGVGIVFTGVAAVAAQVSQTTSGLYGLVGATVGASYLVRGVGDVGDGTLSWLSPIGWGQSMRPFAAERWWVVALMLGAAAALGAVAYHLAAARDEGAGAIAPRPGPPGAGPLLARPVGLSLRLTRGALTGWAAGLLLSGVMLGAIAQDARDILGDSEEVRELLARAGGSIVDQYLAISLLSLAQLAAAYAIQVLLRMRSEESSGRLEVLASTALDRRRWAAGYLAVAAVGTVVVVGACGLGAGVADAIVAGDASRVPLLVGSAVALVPAVWVMGGLTMALVGLVPRAAPAAWGALAGFYLLAALGPLLSLPAWVMDVSPYEHLPLLPGHDVEVVPLVALTAVAAALAAVGVAALRRRDLQTT